MLLIDIIIIYNFITSDCVGANKTQKIPNLESKKLHLKSLMNTSSHMILWLIF